MITVELTGIIGNNTGVRGTWNGGDCSSGVSYYDGVLYRDGLVYETFNTTSTTRDFLNVGNGSFLLEIYATYNGNPCDVGESNILTIFLGNYCIPSSQTNLKFSDLRTFYGQNNIASTNIRLSGISNPAEVGTIFGESDLPLTGTNSKTRPNAVSELRGSCGGVVDTFTTTANSVVKYSGRLAETLNVQTGFLIDSQPSNILFYTPLYSGDPYQICGFFEDTQPGSNIILTNGTYDVESTGSKTIRIAFSINSSKTLTLALALSGNITVKNLGTNATVASTTISLAAGQNPYTNSYQLSWTNSGTTKIGVFINVQQTCIV